MRINELRREELENDTDGRIYQTIHELIDHKNDLLDENRRLRTFLLRLHADCLKELL